MIKLDARKSGSFKVGGEIEIHRLGFGAMRITGPGIWGPPADRAEAHPDAEAPARARHRFHRHRRLLRAGCLRAADPRSASSLSTACSSRPRRGSRAPAPASWEPDGRPDYLREQAIKSCEQARGRADRALAAAPHRSEGAARRSSSARSNRCSTTGSSSMPA